jgi:hypothetical protein
MEVRDLIPVIAAASSKGILCAVNAPDRELWPTPTEGSVVGISSLNSVQNIPY